MSKPHFIYGRHPVLEALKQEGRVLQLYVANSARGSVDEVLRYARRKGIKVLEVPKRTLIDLVGEVVHQGVVAATPAFRYADDVDGILARAEEIGEAPLLVALDQVQDPGNVGAILRSAHALGAHGVLTTKDRGCEVTPTVIKASAGAANHIPVVRVTNLRRTLNELKQRELWVVGLAPESGPPLHEVDFRLGTVLVVGSEGKGIRRLTGEACDVLAHIPMLGQVGSLNASVASALCLYEALRQRTGQLQVVP